MIRRPTSSTRTDPLCPYTTLFLSLLGTFRAPAPLELTYNPQSAFRPPPPVTFKVLLDPSSRSATTHGSPPTKIAPIARARTVAEVWLAIRMKVVARSEEHTSELKSLMRISYAVFCLQKKT